jgi:hypothetical protein
MTLLSYDLSTSDMLSIVEHRISMLEAFIAVNKSIRDNLLQQGLDMSNLDEYLQFTSNLDNMLQALQEKKNSLENQG